VPFQLKALLMSGILMKLLTLALSTLILASCASDKVSQNLYSNRDIGHAIKIKSCTIISSRSVLIRDENAGNKGESLGFFAGNISGRHNSSKPLSGFIGGIVGGAVGRAVSDTLHTREGVEYTVILANGDERQLVQDVADGESILTSGDSCRLQISGANNRVLPSNHYPVAVTRPKTVGFSD
jgi:outer membrane lipoprotein SlyB